MERIITRIEPKENRVLIATFVDGEVIRFDVRTLFERYPVFKVLEDETLFRKVRIDGMGYGIRWNDEIDLASEGIYASGEHIAKTDPDLKTLFGHAVINGRAQKGLSQRDLAQETGIIQAEISKIERGKGNPTLTTMQRIAKALGKSLPSMLR